MDDAEAGPEAFCTAIAGRVETWLTRAPLSVSYRAALRAALALPGNILSQQPDARWSRLVWTCCLAAGGDWSAAVPGAATVELFMVALDLPGDVEDDRLKPLQEELGHFGTLNLTAGLLLLTQWSLLSTPYPSVVQLLIAAGLQACSGQHADLSLQMHVRPTLETALATTEGKSASLVAAICHIGAICAAADPAIQLRYAHFGRLLGMIRQLRHDSAALHSNADETAGGSLIQPALPLHAALRPSADRQERADTLDPTLWAYEPTPLSWVVADVYRRSALELVPHLTHSLYYRAALAALIPASEADVDLALPATS